MNIQFKQWICEVDFTSYTSGNPALKLFDGRTFETIAMCTVNLDGLQEDELAIKDYSENSGMYQTLLDYKIIKPAHRYLDSGFVKNIPICFLNYEGGTYD